VRRKAVPGGLAALSILLIALLLFGLLRTNGNGTQVALDAKVERGQIIPAPDERRALRQLSAPTTSRRLADFRGQFVVLNFWASWCLPCADEAPILERAHRKLVAAKAGTVLGVTFNDTPDDSRSFVKEHGLSYPSLLDPGTIFAGKYGVRALPETFVIDREGRIRAIARGEINEKFLTGALKHAGFTAPSPTR
jgi:cytochrome c biogenesis protein CcmG, thiol:disulfide interchange protein DsbE